MPHPRRLASTSDSGPGQKASASLRAVLVTTPYVSASASPCTCTISGLKRGRSLAANTRATAIVEQGKADGEAARKSQLDAARAEIEVEINRAREELRAQVARIAVAGAEKVLGREIDANAHRDLLGKLAAEL